MINMWGAILVILFLLYNNLSPLIKSMRLINNWDKTEELDRTDLLKQIFPKSFTRNNAIQYFDQVKFKKFTYYRFGGIGIVFIGALVVAIVNFLKL